MKKQPKVQPKAEPIQQLRLDEKPDDIHVTYNSNLFVTHAANREIRRTDPLAESFEKYGYLDAFPMLVSRTTEGKLRIIDGHRRHSVIMEINKERKPENRIPFKYVVWDDGQINISKLNNTQLAWNFRDYLTSYSKQGKADYRRVKLFCEETGIGPSVAILILADQTSNTNEDKGPSRSVSARFKAGDYRITTPEIGQRVAGIVTALRANYPWASQQGFVLALAKACLVKGFDDTVFVQKCRKFPALVKKQVNVPGYIQMIDEVYQRANRNKFPLAWHIQELMRKRQSESKE